MVKYSRLIPILTVLLLASCKSKQQVVTRKSPSNKHTTKRTVPQISKKTPDDVEVLPNPTVEATSVTNKVIRKALSYKGTRYKYGGTTKSGMDCSGLMYSSFKAANVHLPRTSLEQSKQGVRVSKRLAQKGDLVFFKTNGRNRINHVGLVVSVDGRDVKFVHASSSRGVMISSLKEGYWSNAFSELRRLQDIQSHASGAGVGNSSVLGKTYTVVKGDTLYAIARKFNGVSVNDIMTFNKLTSTSLKLGMELKIPSQ
ncbi:MAG: C40 family peptidase [Flavobacteriaceae bacterium]